MMPNNAPLSERGEVSSRGPAPVGEQDARYVDVETRFGPMRFDREQALYMPRGMMGFSDKKTFGLAPIPDPRMQGYVLLQNLTDHDLSFLVMPLEPDNPIIDRADIEAVRESLSIAAGDLAVVLVVSIRSVDGAAQVSVNLRAPVFVDIRNQSAWQHVLSNGRYPIRYVLTQPGTAGGGATGRGGPVK